MLIKHPQLSNWEPYVFFEKEFSPAECEAIIQIAKTLQPNVARTGSSNQDQAAADKSIRSSDVYWLNPTEIAPERQWIFQRLAIVCNKVQQSWYPFKLSGFAEAIQLTHYKAAENGHYDMHKDMGGHEMSTRKLSLVVLLNDPSEFKGGELEILSIPGSDKAVKQVAQGTVIAFPSWELHRVLKITEGERWSLVTWIHGPLFS